MADTTPIVASSERSSTPPSSASEQARIRKERREAKIRAGGSARLDKITGLGGGVPRDVSPRPAASAVQHPDPEEVDISQHYYEPSGRASRPANDPFAMPQPQINEDQLRQMMLGMDPSRGPPMGGEGNPFAGFPGMAGMPGMEGMGGPGGPDLDDPMMKMMQQMMGGMPGGAGPGAGGMPPFPGMPGMPGQAAAAAADPYAYLWRIIHAVFALGLGLYIAFTTTFTGTKLERERSGLYTSTATDGAGLSPASVHFFWIFATAEVVLQTSRFFMEKGVVQPGGIMGTVMGFLPQPYKGYLGLVTRYMRIWTTVSGDAMVCVFVLGVCAWLRTN
ncbi:Uncharacterized protein BP5553_03614 [Venustampulla echinocandica]|uniref:GET complex, subunit GET2 n=1 Tax=Venustampulla echinocandica TaxID=2656787 RepID=A0A370TUS3_9HELO|nr:Uncharacterized protein BP5553_03614 [Venustampulla echinocandica]RDL39274.1 Uncharacterized protein BP5553_03614 [Venustampulla echinocandica]